MTHSYLGWTRCLPTVGILTCWMLLSSVSVAPLKAQTTSSAVDAQAASPEALSKVVIDVQRSVDDRSNAWSALLETVKGADLVPYLKRITLETKDLYASAAFDILMRTDQVAALDVLKEVRLEWPYESQVQAMQDVRARYQVEPVNAVLRAALRDFLTSPPEEAAVGAPDFKQEADTTGGAPTDEMQKALIGSPTRGGSAALVANALAPTATLEERSLILRALDQSPEEGRLWIAAATAHCDFGVQRLKLAQQLMADKKQPLKLRLSVAALLSSSNSSAWHLVSDTLNVLLKREGGADISALFHQYWTGSGKGAEQARDRLFLVSQALPQLFEPLAIMEAGAARRITLKMWSAQTVPLRSMALGLFARRFPEELLKLSSKSDPLLDAQSFNTYLIFIALHHSRLRSQVEKKMGAKLFAAALRRVQEDGITLL